MTSLPSPTGDLCLRHILDSAGVTDLADVLIGYEPRLIRKSIAVERDQTVDPAELKVRFLVRADLNCEPLNVPVQFVADLELDTGKIAIKGR